MPVDNASDTGNREDRPIVLVGVPRALTPGIGPLAVPGMDNDVTSAAFDQKPAGCGERSIEALTSPALWGESAATDEAAKWRL